MDEDTCWCIGGGQWLDEVEREGEASKVWIEDKANRTACNVTSPFHFPLSTFHSLP